MWSNYELVGVFMLGWMMRKQNLRNGEITVVKYLEQKLKYG